MTVRERNQVHGMSLLKVISQQGKMSLTTITIPKAKFSVNLNFEYESHIWNLIKPLHRPALTQRDIYKAKSKYIYK